MTTVLRAGRVPVMAVAILAAVVGCTSGGEVASSCAGLVTYDNRDYLPTEKVDFTVGERLGTATVPECDDTPNDPGVTVPGGRTTAYAVEGVDPAKAIAVGDTAAEARLMEIR